MMISKLAKFCGIAILMLAAAGCSKDRFASEPSLTFKSISSYDISNRQLFEIRLEYTDAEGDLSLDNDGLTILAVVSRCKSDTSRYPYRLPEVPATRNASGEIVIRFANNTQDFLNQGYALYAKSNCVSSSLVDTTTFLFAIKDKAGNVSDTITIDRPVLVRP